MADPLTLRSSYERRETTDTVGWYGTFTIELTVPEQAAFPPGAQLVVWCAMLLTTTQESNARIVERVSGSSVFEPIDHGPIISTGRWLIEGLRSRFPARHANDGPEAAYVVLPDGSTRDVDVVATTTTTPAVGDPALPATPSQVGSPPVVPFPRTVEPPPRFDGNILALRIDPASRHRVLATAVERLAGRLGSTAFDDTTEGATAITLRIDSEIGPESYRASVTSGQIDLVAGDDAGLRHGLVTCAQWAATGIPDDEAWRFPVPEFPALATVGGTRGHGLAVGPFVASGPDPYGRAYTAEEISTWVRRADELGVVLVPEVDVPGHCHAALAAVSDLRDPDDTSRAESVQGYVDNALVPGHPATMPFLEAVFRALADLFQHSPVLHIGGDEVPADAWSGSPLAILHAEERGLHSKREIETDFHRTLIDMIRSTTGRNVAMWEEAALAGLEPSGYAVAWTSAGAGTRLAEAGHDVVFAPGQAYYLDMAPDRGWETPGASWAGNGSLASTCEFDPFDVLDPSLSGNLVGVQACIWGEHIASLSVLDRLVFPRLDAVAERGWNGEVVGGPDDLARRAANLPRFTS